MKKGDIILVPFPFNLRVTSVIKVDRIETVKKADIFARIGELSEGHLNGFIMKFKNLVKSR
jgi:mRNA-degrading endonuclease toxin of MazEF toxin-antitoxin module